MAIDPAALHIRRSLETEEKSGNDAKCQQCCDMGRALIILPRNPHNGFSEAVSGKRSCGMDCCRIPVE